METDKIINNSRLLYRALLKSHVDDSVAHALATAVCTRVEKTTVTEADLRAIAFFENIHGSITRGNYYIAAFAIINGIEELEAVWAFLLAFGYPESRIKDYFTVCSDAFSLKVANLKAILDYFISIGLTKEQILKIFLSAIQSSPEYVKEASECVLKYYDVELLLTLGEGFLFHNVYSDPISAIETVHKILGTELSRKLLENEEDFLYQFKEEFYQNDPTLPMPHSEALEIIEKYKAML